MKSTLAWPTASAAIFSFCSTSSLIVNYHCDDDDDDDNDDIDDNDDNGDDDDDDDDEKPI